MRRVLLLILFCCPGLLYAQANKLDSLKQNVIRFITDSCDVYEGHLKLHAMPSTNPASVATSDYCDSTGNTIQMKSALSFRLFIKTIEYFRELNRHMPPVNTLLIRITIRSTVNIHPFFDQSVIDLYVKPEDREKLYSWVWYMQPG